MSQEKLSGLIVTVELNWGISINYYHSSRGRQSLYVIPPTTLIGAIAYPIAKLMGWPENTGEHSTASKLKDMIKGVYYSIIQGVLIPYTEIGKIWIYKKRDKRAISDVAGIQKLYSRPGTKVNIIYLVDEARASRLLGGDWKKMLVSAAYSITRIGSKESMVAVDYAEVCSVTGSSGNETRYTVPLYNVDKIRGNYVIGEVVDWKRTNIGRYYGSPMIKIAQPQKPLGTPSTVTVIPKTPMLTACDNPLVPW